MFIALGYSYYELYVYVLQVAVMVAVAMSVVVSLDRIMHFGKYVYLKGKCKALGRRPEDGFKFLAFPDEDAYGTFYPIVAIQLPMFNETAVCQACIDHACTLKWPRARFIVQILDDSTDALTRRLVDERVAEWRRRGVDCTVRRRTDRKGYKAGALKEGLEDISSAEFVAIFDADFKPDPDFLFKTVPYLAANAKVGYVQARWTFTNADESYLTKAQEISLNYHVKCEQWVHFASGGYFNFNGTAGVWRRECILDVGGWYSRTTVEDMDLSLRAHIGGWQSIFLDDVTCLNELPSQFSAYRKQQHRWTCGPIQLWRKVWPTVWSSPFLPWYRKLEINLLYFGIRKFSTHIVSLGFFCIVVPLSMFTPEVSIPIWALLHLPIAVTLSTAFFTEGGLLHAATYVLFENAMGIVKMYAVIAGLLNLSRAQEWVVTTKLGSSDRRPNTVFAPPRSCTFYLAEAVVSLFVLTSAAYGILIGNRWSLGLFLALQGLVFLAFAFNAVDCDGWLGKRAVATPHVSRTLSMPVVAVKPEADKSLSNNKFAGAGLGPLGIFGGVTGMLAGDRTIPIIPGDKVGAGAGLGLPGHAGTVRRMATYAGSLSMADNASGLAAKDIKDA